MKNKIIFRFAAIVFAVVLCVTVVGENVMAASRPTFTLKARKKKSVTIKINKKGKVTGYKIYISNSKRGKYRQVGVAMMSMTYKLTGLKKDKTYYIKIRSYRTKGTRIVNGKFSKAVKVPKYIKKRQQPTKDPVGEESPSPEESPLPEETFSPDPSPLPDSGTSSIESTLPDLAV